MYQVKYPDKISVLLQINTQISIEFGFGVCDNQAFPTLYALKDRIPGISPALHGAACSEYSNISVQPRVFRKADRLSIQLSQKDTSVMGKVCHQLKDLFPFGICHIAGCTVGSLVGICNVPLFIMSSVLVPFHPVKQDCEIKQHSGS